MKQVSKTVVYEVRVNITKVNDETRITMRSILTLRRQVHVSTFW